MKVVKTERECLTIPAAEVINVLREWLKTQPSYARFAKDDVRVEPRLGYNSTSCLPDNFESIDFVTGSEVRWP